MPRRPFARLLALLLLASLILALPLPLASPGALTRMALAQMAPAEPLPPAQAVPPAPAAPAAPPRPAEASPAPRPAPPAAHNGNQPASPGRAASLPPGEAERMLGVLRDETRRNELIRSLETLGAAERARREGGTPAPAEAPAGALPPAPASASSAAPVEGAAAPPSAAAAPTAEAPATPQASSVVVPNNLVGQIASGAAERLRHALDQVMAGARVLADLPAVASWASGVARDPVARVRITDAAWKMLLTFGLGVLAEIAVYHLLRVPRRRLDAMAPAPGGRWNWLRRVPVVAGRLLLDLLPVLGFALVAYPMVEAVRPLPTTELVLLTINNAYVLCRAIMMASRMLLSPASAHLRLVRMPDETAAYFTRWLRRIVGLSVFGYALAEASLQFGVPWAVHDGIIRLIMLLVSLMLVIVVVQKRQVVAGLLRAPALPPGEEPSGSRAALRTLRNRLAEIWHVVVILWLLALWGVWALEVPDGFSRLLRGTGATLLILGVAKGLDVGLRQLLDRAMALPAGLAARYPGLELRATRYGPLLRGLVSGVLTVAALLLLLEAWGIGAFAWFTQGRLGSRILGALGSIGVSALVAILVWEVANSAIARQLTKASREGQAARSARVRTLLPMMRTALMIVILIFLVLNVLSEIGVNVAPLIAGASVVGVAIGFGSQTLVKDVVTGLFLLLEDAVAVGDSVTLGTPPQTGVVERLSIRSIRLRAMDGSVHIIPFSAVTSVTNMTRDFAFAMLEFSLSYGEDTDRVAEVLRQIAKEMRAEARWSGAIRDDLDVMGVDRLLETGVVLRARLKTEPSQRFPVGREMNRRIQARFEELGIVIPSPWRKAATEEDQMHATGASA
ncbi:Mechanosensitive ion channel [Roseomonas mucosa]|uniref:Potassium efflux system KefA n=3 Tax=Roseomonas mucosa TaxID=207340 RepID=A0A379N2G8_9PROT|nr:MULTISPECIES: mechanosensitive ion channel domain-containing protein [Roseomonas]MBS5902093.1 mechanosensitive ion channel [Acetobacteraceae bacterium]MDT8288615.1 mechanosensitive ion channel [Roseomonas mucosa]MDT8293382.1 mechanosensitive ion channel [Roseomonas mucosa]MDT8313080.1 mechanosensitive ion channel [Roseomonas mucosa]MDT8348667.1 mechanosensitive ion channel [Roseomonas mucosa]